MKKSIFLFFAAILCATNAWAAKERVYFVNTPGWTEVNVYAWTDGGASLTWPGATATKDSWQWNGQDVYYYEAEAGTYKKCIFNNGSAQSADLTWTANSVYANEAGKWTPVEIAKATTNGTKVYFVNTEKWTTVKVYAFSYSPKDTKNAAWPGANATKESDKIGEYDVYSFTMNKEYDYCIFTNGASSNTKQTADLVVMNGADKYYCKDNWYTKEGAAEKVGAPIEYETVYFVNAEDWTGTISAYAYTPVQNAAWPGEPAAKEDYQIGGKNVYSYTAEKGKYKNVIFSGTGGQTADLTWTAGKYYVRDNWYTKEEAEAKLAAPIVTYDYYIAGTEAMTGHNWNPVGLGIEDNDGDGIYSHTFTLNAGGDYQFKVTQDSDWDPNWGYSKLDKAYDGVTNSGDDGENIKINLTETKTITVHFDSKAGSISLEGLDSQDKVTYDYYIAGPLAGGWSATQMGMEKVAEGQYTCEFTKDAGDYQFKVTNGKWGNETGGFDCADVEGSYEEVSHVDGNVNVKLTATTTFTVKFDSNTKKISFEDLTEKVIEYGVTFNVTVPEGTEACYICGAWDWNTFKPMTKVDDTHYTLEIAEATKDHGYKYTCGEGWEFVEKDAEGNDLASDRTWSENDVVAAWAAPAEPVEMASVVLMGVDGDWATGVEMELNPNDANEYMLLCQSITADEPIKIKAVDTQSTVTWCAKLADTSLGSVVNDADGNENIVLEEGKYDFYYKVAENEVWIGTCDETPEVGGEMDLLVTDLVIMEDSDAQMALLMGTDGEVGIEFALMLTGYTGEYNKEYQLSADESVLSLSGEESLVSGSLTKISDPDLGDVYQGVVYATLMGMYWQFNLTMYYVEVPAIEINVNNATVVEELYDNFVGGTGSEWSLSGNWTYEGEPATVKVTIYDEVDKSVPQKEMQVDVETDYGFVQGNAMVIIDATTMTVQGELSNQMSGAKYKFNISGALPTCPTIRLSIADNKNVLAATNNTKVNVIVNRSFEANDGYYTLCLPFDMQASVVGKAYQISTITEHAAQGINVEFTEVTTMLAGQPYLIKPNDLDNFTVEAVTIKNTTTPVTVTGEGISITMQGMFNRDGKTNGLYWVGNGGYLYNDDVYTNGLCAYFNISTPSGVAPRMRVVTKEDAETGVEDIFSTDAPVKAIVNGQLIIIRDGVKYNVQGQKL